MENHLNDPPSPQQPTGHASASRFPAVAIGGPPHSGKSVLTYSLTQALRAAGVDHYVLRACPDGEGDWSYEAPQDLVKTIRDKGAYSPTFVDRVVRDLERRHLPLLVDVGGRPRPWQEVVFDHCTHAVLLVAAGDSAAYKQERMKWSDMMARHGVPVIADLQSVLEGTNILYGETPVIRGVLSRLERGETAGGPAFQALVERLREVLFIPEERLKQTHLQQAPAELALDLPRLARTLGAPDGVWQPEQLRELCNYLPAAKPLALYGRAPNWIVAALAVLSHPAELWLFDPRLGWVAPPTLPIGHEAEPAQRGWQCTVDGDGDIGHGDIVIVRMATGSQRLDIEHPSRLPLPPIAAGRGVILDGRLPYWLLASAVRHYGPRSAWLAIFHPPLDGAVVVFSRKKAHEMGQLVALS